MSNGGIIGPVNDPIVSVASSPGTATFNSSGTYTSGPQAKLVEYLVVAGGGGGSGMNSTSGGGGGAWWGCNGNGGSGIVIVRAPGNATFSVGPATNTVTTLPAPAGGCKVATFTVSGTLTTG